MARTLDPGTQLGRYRIVSPLGAGGMGEVYLARDESLDRSVALKILPPDLIKNDERVRRFVQEAKSASSLNHPHIVTIYEIGEAEDIHFIAMELVSGHTLKTLIHQEKTDLRTLVRYLAQAAEGLAKAHAAGIVHRDLKPENIMVTSDGFAKVVDFGLAKLTETTHSGTDLTSAPTALARGTDAGVVLGTVGYMSPEQVQGKTVDQRSDIFSLGCVLYEAATRQRPFQADSDVETLHKILKDAPPPVDELNPDVPADLRRVIRRCLAKSPDRRLQSMKDLALDLAEIDETYETLSISTGSGTTTSAIEASRAAPRSWLLPAAAIAIGVAGLGFGLWQWLGSSGGNTPASFASLEITPLTRITDMESAMLSSDGRLLAYASAEAGRYSLIVRQMVTSQDLVIVPPQDARIDVGAVAPDSSYIYYSQRVQASAVRDLYRVPSIGGTPRLVMRGTNGYVGLSPDGARLVSVVRQPSPSREVSIVIANADGTENRTLATIEEGGAYTPVWSPDSRRIAAAVYRTDDMWERLVAFDVSDGTEAPLTSDEWDTYGLAWLPDGSGLVAAAVNYGAGSAGGQLWFIPWPEGAARRITNDTNDYDGILSVSADGLTLTTTLVRSGRSLWSTPADRPGDATRVSGEPPTGLWPLGNGRVLYATATRDNRWLWTMNPDGTDRQRLTPDRLNANWTWCTAARADVIVFGSLSDDGLTSRLWRVDSRGGGLAEVPDGDQKLCRAVSPDGLTIYYQKLEPSTRRTLPQIWRRPLAGGAEELFGDPQRAGEPVFSPDGQRFFRDIRVEPGAPRQVEMVATDDGRVLGTLTLPDIELDLEDWAPTSDAILFTRTNDGAENVWQLPIDGRPPTQLTRFGPDEFNGSFAYTADGTQLLFLRDELAPGEVLQFRNWR